MTKMNELEESPRAPIGAWAASQDPSLYCRFCCQVVASGDPAHQPLQTHWAPPALQALAASLPAPAQPSAGSRASSPLRFCLNFAEMLDAEAALKG